MQCESPLQAAGLACVILLLKVDKYIQIIHYSPSERYDKDHATEHEVRHLVPALAPNAIHFSVGFLRCVRR